MNLEFRVLPVLGDEWNFPELFLPAAELYEQRFGKDKNKPDPHRVFRPVWHAHLQCTERVQTFLASTARDPKPGKLHVAGFACAHPLMRDLDPVLRDLLAFQTGMTYDPERTLLVSPLVVAPDVNVYQVVKELVDGVKKYASKCEFAHVLLWAPTVPPQMAILASQCGLETCLAGRLLDDNQVIPPSAVIYWGATS